MTSAKIVTAALICRDGKILAAQRPTSDHLALLWEFPGGKLEAGETHEACLARELKEEFGVEAKIGSFFQSSLYTYSAGEINLVAYWATLKSYELNLVFHRSVMWCDRHMLVSLAFAPADVPIVERLKQTNSWMEQMDGQVVT
jgi:8-oxo-dGTP diphosphatase